MPKTKYRNKDGIVSLDGASLRNAIRGNVRVIFDALIKKYKPQDLALIIVECAIEELSERTILVLIKEDQWAKEQ